MSRLFDGLRTLGVPLIHFGVGTAGLLALQARAGGDLIGLDWRIALADGWARVGERGRVGGCGRSRRRKRERGGGTLADFQIAVLGFQLQMHTAVADRTANQLMPA